MKRLLTGITLSMATVTGYAASGAAATTTELDVGFYSFRNACTEEWVTPQQGETLRAVFRFEEDENRMHLVNRAAGQVDAYGVTTNDQYIMSAVLNAIILPEQPSWTSVNLEQGSGTLDATVRWEIIKPRDPTGVSISYQVLRLVLSDGVVTHLFAEPLSSDCAGR